MRAAKGFALFEVLIAFACLAMVAVPIAGILMSMAKSQQISLDKVGTQQATSMLNKQFLYDLRFSKGIFTCLPLQLTLKNGDTPAVFVFYKLEGGYLKRGVSSVLATPPTTWISYPDPNSGATLSGGTFQYLDRANLPTLATGSICSVGLAGSTLIGIDSATFSIPTMTVADRYALPQEGGSLIWLRKKKNSARNWDICLKNATANTLQPTSFSLVWKGSPIKPALTTFQNAPSRYLITTGVSSSGTFATVWTNSSAYPWLDNYLGAQAAFNTFPKKLTFKPNGTNHISGSYRIRDDELWLKLIFSNNLTSLPGTFRLKLYEGVKIYAVSFTLL
jgi:hypothetical protein